MKRVREMQSYSSLSYFPCEFPIKFLYHKSFTNASLPPIPFQVQIPFVASLQGRMALKGQWIGVKMRTLFFRDRETSKEICLQ